MKFQKRPVVIDAVQWFKHGDHPAVEQYGQGIIDQYPAYAQCGTIKTLEDNHYTRHHVVPGDWIITGVKGEQYPCKPDVFEQTYEAPHDPA